MKKYSKVYNQNVALIEKPLYSLEEGIDCLKKMTPAKFDETVEFTIKLGVDVRQSDQQVRGTLILPHGVGKKIKIVVIAKGEKVVEAEKAGADAVGSEDMVDKIKAGWVDFDILLTTPDMMKEVGQLGKVLGKRGLMPSPKTGTITFDLKKAIEEFRKGKIEYRADKYGIVHMPVGKKSFDGQKLKENIVAVYDVLVKAKPASAKGVYLKGTYLSATMGPGLDIDSSTIA